MRDSSRRPADARARAAVLTILAATALLAGDALVAATRAAQPGIAVQDPWVRATPGRNSAAFLVIRNHGDAADRLLEATSAAAASVEVHRTTMENGVMRMRPAGVVEVPAGGTVTLAPGGLHIMLIGVKQPLQEGDTVALTLRFERTGAVAVKAPVRPMRMPPR